MTDNNLPPIKFDVKIDSKDAAKVINKLIDTIRAPFAHWAKHQEPVKQAKAEMKASLIREEN